MWPCGLQAVRGAGRRCSFDQVESIEEHGLIVLAVAQPVEARHPVVVAGHRFAIEDHRRRIQAAQRLQRSMESDRSGHLLTSGCIAARGRHPYAR